MCSSHRIVAGMLDELESTPLGLPDGLELEWLGVAGYRLTYEGVSILVDPYVSRVPLRTLLLRRPALPDHDADRPLRPRPAPVAGILVGHTHWDHAVDAPALARRFGAPAYGSDSLAHLMRLHGLAERRGRAAQALRARAVRRAASRPAGTRSCCSGARCRSTGR